MSSWLGRRFVGFLIIAVAMTVAAYSFVVRFATDDYGFRAILTRHGRSALDLFDFAPGAVAENHRLITYGVLPWWSAPDLKLHFLRPLTGVLFALDMRFFGNEPFGYHVHSLLWLLALLLTVRLLLRRFLPGPTATLALAVFAFRSAHVLPYAWLSARHVLVAAVPAALALLVHTRRADKTGSSQLVFAPILLVVGLAGSEAALAIVPFFLAHEITLAVRTGERRRALFRALPTLVVAIAYLAIYRALGCGARSSGGYHDPLANPRAFLGVALTRVPMLLADALLGTPVSAGSASHAGVLVVIGLVGVLLCAVLYRSTRMMAPDERSALSWLVPAALLALVVGATGLPGGRVLVIPDIGFAALLGVLVRHTFSATGSAITKWARRAGGAVLVAQHLLLAPLVCLRVIHVVAETARGAEQVASTADIGETKSPRAFLVAASDPFVFLYPRSVLADTAPGRIRCFTPLSGARGDHRVTRSGPRTLIIEPLGDRMLDGFDNLYRDHSHPFAAGEHVRDCGADIQIMDVSDGVPTRFEVTFDYIEDLDRAGESSDPLVILAWNGKRLAHVVPPAIGEAVVVPWYPGPGQRAGL